VADLIRDLFAAIGALVVAVACRCVAAWTWSRYQDRRDRRALPPLPPLPPADYITLHADIAAVERGERP
jgi:hypothetical protein